MSDAQQEHALAIEHVAPRLRALRIELCPCHMSESYFWKVYFVLLHSRLEKHDADLLSTPQVKEARAMWMRELKKQTRPEFDWPERSTNHLNEYENDDILHDKVYPGSPSYFNAQSIPFEAERSSRMMHNEIEKLPPASSETEAVDKSAIGEKPANEIKFKDSPRMLVENFDGKDDDDWPEEEEEDSDLVGYGGAVASTGIEEDISFSDLEDDLAFPMPIKSKSAPDREERSS